MTARWVYPRLGPLEASQLLEQLQTVGLKPATSWPGASPPPVGIVVPEDVLTSVRQAAVDAAAAVTGQAVQGTVAEWDAAVGSAIHSEMAITPADAAHEGVWSFLALILMPDLAAQRFPDLHPDRILGRPRNVFRRLWWRREVLGDLPVPAGRRPLGEDEYVNIFERSHMSRCRPLARALAMTILSYGGDNRSAFTRELAKNVRRTSGPLLLDVLSESQLLELVVGQALALGATIDLIAPPTATEPATKVDVAAPAPPLYPGAKREPGPSEERTPVDVGHGSQRRSFRETLADLVGDNRLSPGAVLGGTYRALRTTSPSRIGPPWPTRGPSTRVPAQHAEA